MEIKQQLLDELDSVMHELNDDYFKKHATANEIELAKQQASYYQVLINTCNSFEVVFTHARNNLKKEASDLQQSVIDRRKILFFREKKEANDRPFRETISE